MEPNGAYKHLILIAIAILLASVTITFRRVGVNRSRSISQHISSQSGLCLFNGVVLSMGAVLMALYFHFWFIPLHGLPLAAEVFIGIGLTMQLIFAVFPDYGDNSLSSRIHRSCNYVMGVSMALFMFIAFYNTHGIARLGFGIASLTLTVYAIVFQTQKTLWRNFLVHQSLFFAIFLTTVLALGYWVI